MTERTYSDRGFAQHQPIPAGTAYGGTVRVYESSSALAPRIWLAVEALTQSATIHLSQDAGTCAPCARLAAATDHTAGIAACRQAIRTKGTKP